ncbi:hypothetical protein BJ508DRAFT_349530 [Ascobolus immersus RN42]|uniref:Uncharacterized protein n=1 Tax=Ascobolus immersus RN42 TaxID=1160509 RepID=A0A3N4I2G8_ASCIM|nr:hypothetical protein BJ508DRAFT_349530 [Ascobolus immersus RN42]
MALNDKLLQTVQTMQEFQELNIAATKEPSNTLERLKSLSRSLRTFSTPDAARLQRTVLRNQHALQHLIEDTVRVAEDMGSASDALKRTIDWLERTEFLDEQAFKEGKRIARNEQTLYRECFEEVQEMGDILEKRHNVIVERMKGWMVIFDGIKDASSTSSGGSADVRKEEDMDWEACEEGEEGEEGVEEESQSETPDKSKQPDKAHERA